MPKPTIAELNELRRKAYQWGPLDTARLLAQTGIPPDLLPVQQANLIVGCTLTWLRKRIRDGSIPHYRVGSRVLVPLSAVVQRQALGGKGSQTILKPSQPAESKADQFKERARADKR